MTHISETADRGAATIVRGLRFPEAPRWHDGALWYVEIPAHRIHRTTPDGRDEVVAEFSNRPASMDFLPSGEAIVALGDALTLVRLDGSLYADLSAVTLNGARFEKFADMVIDGRGRIYVGCVGARDSLTDAGRTDIDAIVMVTEAGDVSIVATGDIDRPNGMAISASGDRLVVGESLAKRLCQWDIEADGALVNQRIFAHTGDDIPDGICLDEAGGAWVAGVHSRRTVRVVEGGMGEATHIVATEEGRFSIAPMLGGESGRDLFVVTCATPSDDLRGHEDVVAAVGFVEVARVDFTHAGWPGN